MGALSSRHHTRPNLISDTNTYQVGSLNLAELNRLRSPWEGRNSLHGNTYPCLRVALGEPANWKQLFAGGQHLRYLLGLAEGLLIWELVERDVVTPDWALWAELR